MRTLARLNAAPTSQSVQSFTVVPATVTESADALDVVIGQGYEGPILTIEWTELVENKRVIKTYDKLILSSVNESFSERADSVYTFNQPILHTTSGQQPILFVFNVRLLINKLDGDSRTAFIDLYNKKWRSSVAAVSKDEPLRFRYRNSVVYGYMVSLDVQTESSVPGAASAMFTVFVSQQLIV